MDKRNLKWITWSFVGVTIVIVAMMLGSTLRRTSHVTLPQTGTGSGQITENSDDSGDALTVIEVAPETVQTAILTLNRPESYSRTVTVEQFWDDGSASYETDVTVYGGWTRVDRAMPDGRIRHTITGDETVYVWYNHEDSVYTAAAGVVSADHEQTIPTYEDVLELPVEMIATADYRMISDVDCIYVETCPDASGYVLRYWISVDTGLLTVAEKLVGEKPVYRMASLSVELIPPNPAEFILPDGTELIE